MACNTSPAKAVSEDSSAPHLTCYFRTHSKNGDDGSASTESTSGKALLCQEKGKKSSFLLQPKRELSSKDANTKDGIDWYSVPKPAQLFVQHDKHPTSTNEPNKTSFFFGGLQLISDAKNIEIYLTSPEGKETYLMTSKGIPYKMTGKENTSQESGSTPTQTAEWRRALCVVPGGPRCISSLRVKLIGSTSTTDSTAIKVHFLKVTARIVMPSSPPARTTATRSPMKTSNPQGAKSNSPSFSPNMFAPPTPTRNMTSHSEPPLTQKDLGAAMAGLSFMARKTEENMANLFKEQSKQIEGKVEAYLSRMELQMRALKPTLAMQFQLIKENQTIMKEQQQIMECQATQINKILSDNQDLQVRVQSLQADVSILRSQSTYDNTGKDNSCTNDADKDANIDADASATNLSAKLSCGEQKSDDAGQSPSDDDDSIEAKKNIIAENARLRNAIKNIARGIEGESILGGCGSNSSSGNVDPDYPPYGALGIDEKDAAMENLRLRNTIQTIARGIDEEPFACGVAGSSREKYPETGQIKLTKQVDEIPIDSGCGYLLEGMEGGLMRQIDSAIASRIKPSAIPLDTTRSLENIKKKYSDEVYTHTPTIEVELMQDQQTGKDKKGKNDDSPSKRVSWVDSKIVDEAR